MKGASESTLVTDLSVPLMHHDLSDFGSLIVIQITPKEGTLIKSVHNDLPPVKPDAILLKILMKHLLTLGLSLSCDSPVALIFTPVTNLLLYG